MQTRRDILAGGLAVGALLALGGCGKAPPGQSRAPALELLVPSGPGGGWDQTARSMERVLVGAGLAERIRVEYAQGGGGAVGLARFLTGRGRPDTLLVAGMVMVGALATSRAPVALVDATPIARLTGEYEVVAVHRDSPLASMADLLAQWRADPGSVSWAGGAAGGADHILVALIAEQAGVPFADVAYLAYAGGGLAQATLLGNQVTCGVSGWGELSAQIEAGNLRALAISAPKRVPGIDVPTLREAGVAVDLANWRGVFGAPAIAPAERDALVDLVRQMTATPAWREELAAHGWTNLFLPGEDFARFLAEETARIDAALTRIGLVP